MKIPGEPMPVIEGMRLGDLGAADLAVSETGTLVYATGAGEGKTEVVWVTRDGKAQPVDPDWQGQFAYPALSPDGKQLAVSMSVLSGRWDIWIKQLDRGLAVNLTLDGQGSSFPAWTPDGRSVTFGSITASTNSADLLTKRADGSANAALQFHEKWEVAESLWSPDGKWLIFTDIRPPGPVQLLAMRPGIDTAPIRLVRSNFGQYSPALSRDGHWLAYDSNLNGNADIYKVPVSGGEAQQLTRDPTDDFAPSWSPDGREIVFHSFRNGNRDIFVISADGSRTETVVATPSQELVGRWSPDGRSIAYFAYPDSVFIVSRTAAGWGKPKFLTRGTTPNFSPDGTRIAFAVPTGLVVMPANGGPQKQIYAGASGALDWSRDSRFIYYCNGLNAFLVIPSTGGPPKPLLRLRDPLRQLYRGNFTVDPNHIYFTIGSRESDIWVMELNRK